MALAVLEGMLAPFVSSGLLVVLLDHRPLAVETPRPDTVGAVTLLNTLTGSKVTVSAAFVLDATELGDLLPLSKAEFVTGAESRSVTGEPSAPEQARPANAQAFSVCFAMDHCAGEDHTIERPSEYDFWRGYVPQLDPPWPGPLLSWETSHPRTLEPIRYHFAPAGETGEAFGGLWTYRRILDRSNFEPGAFRSDITIVNWPMLDYMEGDLCTSTLAEQEQHLSRARQLSLSLFYWLQTEAPSPDGGVGWPGLRLRGDLVGSNDGLAKRPYIRESRRIRAHNTIVEQDVSAAFRPDCDRAQHYEDSVGIGYYRIDLHPSRGGDNYIDVPALPFQIPLSALVPQRIENLLAAAKSLGVTQITNGCYRLHPVEWNIGEAAGLVAAFCLERRTRPKHVLESKVLLGDFQRGLIERGVDLAWPENLDLNDCDPHRHAIGQ